MWDSLGPRFFRPAGFGCPEERTATFPAYAPLRALDALYARGDVGVSRLFRSRLAVARRASDHLPLIADAEIHS